MTHKFKEGDKVIYDGLVGIVVGLTESAGSGEPMLNLEAEMDRETSCTVLERECQEFTDEIELEQEHRLNEINFNSSVVLHKIDGLTDKYFRDGNH